MIDIHFCNQYCALIVTDYGEVFNAFSSNPVGVGRYYIPTERSSYHVLPVSVPIRPTQVFSRNIGYNFVVLVSDDEGHLYYINNRQANRATFQLLDNIGEKIVDIYINYDFTTTSGEDVFIFVTTSTKTILYVVDATWSGDTSISNYMTKTVLTKKLSKIEDTYNKSGHTVYCVLYGTSLYMDTENGNITSGMSPDFTNVKDFAVKSNRSTASSDGTFVRVLFVLKTNGTLEVYKCNIKTSANYSLEKLSDFPVETATSITHVIVDNHMLSNGKVRITPFDHSYLYLQTSDKVYQISMSVSPSTIGTIQKTYDSTSDSIFIPTFECALLSNGSIRFFGTNVPSNSSYYDTGSKTLTLPSTKITKVVSTQAVLLMFTANNKLFSFTKAHSFVAYPYLFFSSGQYTVKEITTFPVHGAGYRSSQLRETLCSFESCLPEDLQAVISPITKYTADIVSTVNISDYSHVLSLTDETKTSDKIFTFSDYEIFGKKKPSITNLKTRVSYEPPDQPYAYYENGGEGRSTDRKKHNGTARTRWWTRSCHLYTDRDDVQRVCSSEVQSTGLTSRNSAPVAITQRASLGIVPCFAIAADIT